MRENVELNIGNERVKRAKSKFVHFFFVPETTNPRLGGAARFVLFPSPAANFAFIRDYTIPFWLSAFNFSARGACWCFNSTGQNLLQTEYTHTCADSQRENYLNRVIKCF